MFVKVKTKISSQTLKFKILLIIYLFFDLAYRFKNIGFDVTKNELDYLYQEFLKIADTKKEVVNEDLQVMMAIFSQKTV